MPKQSIKEFKTANRDLVVRIYARKSGTLLYAKGIDVKTRIEIPGCKAKLRLPLPLNEKQVPDFERMLIRKIEVKFEKLTAPTQQNTVHSEAGIYTAAFATIDDKSIFHQDSWNDDTFNKSISYFEKQVLPLLDNLGLDISREDIRSLHEELITRAKAHSKSYGIHNNVAYNLSGRMYRIDRMYQVLRDASQTFNLLDIDLCMNNKRKKIQTEQPKALPNHMRIMLARLFFRLIATTFGGLALAAAMMLFTNLRTAESAAVYFGKIKKYNTYAKYFVEYQEKDRKATNLLKTDNAYRWVILPQIMTDLLAERYNYLISLGYSDDYIKTLPITYIEGDPSVLTRSHDISAFVRKLLLLIGCNDRYFAAIYNLMHEEPDIVDNEKVNDVSAYILRRDWATRACNVCGLKSDQVDYLIGHAIKKGQKVDYQTPESQAAMAYALERYVFDPDHSRNPAFSPIELNPGKRVDFLPSQAFVFEAKEKEVLLEITASCIEPGIAPKIIISPGSTGISITRFSIIDRPESRQTRPLIGDIMAVETYVHWIDKANNIDLKKLEEK